MGVAHDEDANHHLANSHQSNLNRKTDVFDAKKAANHALSKMALCLVGLC